MGRLPLGAGVEPVDRRPIFSRKPNARRLLVATRRRPYGFYSVLQLTAAASVREIRKAYLAKCLEYHPDKHATATRAQKAAFTKQMQAVTDAYAVLSDPEKRAQYDRKTLGIGAELEQKIETLRSKVHRHRQSADERAVSISLNTARRRLQQMPLANRYMRNDVVRRKLYCKKETSMRSKVVAPGKKWRVCIRRRSERKKDKRLGKFVAVI